MNNYSYGDYIVYLKLSQENQIKNCRGNDHGSSRITKNYLSILIFQGPFLAISILLTFTTLVFSPGL